jgi:hypothetical protein
MGDGYVCPSPTMGGNGPGLVKHSSACGTPASNMGSLAHCPQVQVGGSVGGMMFTATGQLSKKKRACGHKKSACKCDGQCGSKCKCKTKGRYSLNSNSPLFNDMLNHIGDSSTSHDSSNYKNGHGTPINGYYLDLASAPIGNRPVHGTHDNIKVNDQTVRNGNLIDRKFDCQQPFWCEKCL